MKLTIYIFIANSNEKFYYAMIDMAALYFSIYNTTVSNSQIVDIERKNQMRRHRPILFNSVRNLKRQILKTFPDAKITGP